MSPPLPARLGASRRESSSPAPIPISARRVLAAALGRGDSGAATGSQCQAADLEGGGDSQRSPHWRAAGGPARGLSAQHALLARTWQPRSDGVDDRSRPARSAHDRDPLVIEGAGGVLVPVTRRLLGADLFARWGCPRSWSPAPRSARSTTACSRSRRSAPAACRSCGVAFVGEAHARQRSTPSPDRRRVAGWDGSRSLDSARSPASAAAFARAFTLDGFPRYEFPGLAPLHPAWARRADPANRCAPRARRCTREDGRRFVDAISSWWVTTHGHRHPRIMAAIAEQARQAWTRSSSPAGRTSPPRRSPRELVGSSRRPGLAPCVLSPTAARPAVEVALKMALGFWHNRGEPRNAYRGARAWLSWRHDRRDVGRRARRVQPAYAALAVRRGDHSFPEPGRSGRRSTRWKRCAVAGAPPRCWSSRWCWAPGGMQILSRQPAGRDARDLRGARRAVHRRRSDDRLGTHRHAAAHASRPRMVPDILCLSKGLTGGAIPLAVTLATRRSSRHIARRTAPACSSTRRATPPTRSPARPPTPTWRSGATSRCGARIADLGDRQQDHLDTLSRHPLVRNPRRLGTIVAAEIGTGGIGLSRSRRARASGPSRWSAAC